MKIKVKVKLCTDGDFSIDKERLYDFKDCLIKDDDEYIIKHTFNIKKQSELYGLSEIERLKCDTKSFLEIVLTSIRVTYTHCYLLKTLYDFFDKAVTILDSMEVGDIYTDRITGNYEGTKIRISILE